jgi:hypothetical protein
MRMVRDIVANDVAIGFDSRCPLQYGRSLEERRGVSTSDQRGFESCRPCHILTRDAPFSMPRCWNSRHASLKSWCESVRVQVALGVPHRAHGETADAPA